jgi:hypothetical protein
MKHPKGAIFARVSYMFRTKRFAEAFIRKCRAAELTVADLDREDSRRGFWIVNVWLYRGEELP